MRIKGTQIRSFILLTILLGCCLVFLESVFADDEIGPDQEGELQFSASGYLAGVNPHFTAGTMPGWEFDIEETIRDGPLLSLDSGDVYAVDLIGDWFDVGAQKGPFAWTDTGGDERTADFENDVLPLFIDEDAWFEGSQACTECHFDNSEDSRHEMDLSSLEGIMKGGDVLSEPPGVAIVVPGDWEDSKLQARLRNNRVPPGWEFDIEETNRDGPIISAGRLSGAVGDEDAPVTVAEGEPPVDIAAITTTRTVDAAETQHIFLVLFGLMMLIFGVIVAFIAGNRLRTAPEQTDRVSRWADIVILIFAIVAVITSGLLLYAFTSDAFKTTVTITERIPASQLDVPAVAEVRLEEWQARIPSAYDDLTNPHLDDPAAAEAGRQVFLDYECSNCHGEGLEGDGSLSDGLRPKPVNLTDPALMNLPFVSDAYLYWRISEGGASPPFLSAMPAWRQIIPEDQRWQLVTYIRSQVSDEVVDAGEQAAIAVVEKAGCFACHRLESIGRGGRIGPGWDNLGNVAQTRIADMTAEEYVLASILKPDVFVVPGFEGSSAMPGNYDEILSDEEINILVEFLLQQE